MPIIGRVRSLRTDLTSPTLTTLRDDLAGFIQMMAGRRRGDSCMMEQSSDHRSWFHEHRVEVLLLNELVGSRIARYTGGRGKRSVVHEIGEFFASTNAGYLLRLSNARLQQARRTHPGKNRSELMPWPIGRTIVAVLCSFAYRDQEWDLVIQGSDGCTLVANAPFSAIQMPLILTVDIHGDEGGSLVETKTEIPGGVRDWGKSKRILEDLYTDIPDFVSLDDHL